MTTCPVTGAPGSGTRSRAAPVMPAIWASVSGITRATLFRRRRSWRFSERLPPNQPRGTRTWSHPVLRSGAVQLRRDARGGRLGGHLAVVERDHGAAGVLPALVPLARHQDD